MSMEREHRDELVLANLEITVKEAIKKIDLNAKKTLFLCDEEGVLVGVVTDGDIRRWILKNQSLDRKVSEVMNRNPIRLCYTECSEAKQIMLKNKIEALPIVDEQGKIMNIVYWSDLFQKKFFWYEKNLDLDVVIMAGGTGSRLYPYTKILPKPLIPINEIPISERIMDKFATFGCRNFYMIVNYKKNMIKSYFSEINKDYRLSYVDEDVPLGTAGSLSALKNRITKTFFMSNCDILVEADYTSIYRHHQKEANKLTIVASLKNYVIPYGVLDINQDSQVVALQEKPENHYLVNTGMYMMEPELLDYIPKDQFFHMTDLIQLCMEKGLRVGTYPVSEGSWLDMGEFSQMEIMREKLNE